MSAELPSTGEIIRVAGPVVEAAGLPDVHLFDVVRVGHQRLIGEVIHLIDERAVIQVYESTSGVRIGEPVLSTGAPLVVALGPGLLGRIYDGLQRPLVRPADGEPSPAIPDHDRSSLSMTHRWTFDPCLKPGDRVVPGVVLGTVPETPILDHRIMLPPGLSGTLISVERGEFTLSDVIAVVEDADGHRHQISMRQEWPVRRPRPAARRLDPTAPLVTGTRIVDALFPVARGGSAVVPGGFGTGKTVLEQTLARLAEVDVVIYIGCGERGNEIAEVLDEFPQLIDPHTGESLMDRTVLIANTSNMPVAAREASIYTGVTIAEYYRDMGYDVLLLADSTSRWGEAMREISGRLEEIPGEEGYPAYLGARLAEFYERAGAVALPDGQEGSVTIIGAVSPPGADFSEPITQNSLRLAGTFWGLDYELSRRRHFPAISWTQSYTLYNLEAWYAKEVGEDWPSLIRETRSLLQQAEDLRAIIQLVGAGALSPRDQLLLAVADMLRDDFLQQSSFDPVDAYSPLPKTYRMLNAIIEFYHCASERIDAGDELEDVLASPAVADIARMRGIAYEKIDPDEQPHTVNADSLTPEGVS